MGNEIKSKKIKKCYIICGYLPEINGEILNNISSDDFVVCADNGYEYALQNDIVPDLIIGDFDSYKGKVPNGDNTIVLPAEKDDTDLMYSLKHCINLGMRDFIITGATGGRCDHTLASLTTLYYALSIGCTACIYDKNTTVYVTNKGLNLKAPEKHSYFSVFPVTEEAKVSICGGKYNLKNKTLKNSFPLGVSNEFDSDLVEITVSSGSVYVLVTQ